MCKHTHTGMIIHCRKHPRRSANERSPVRKVHQREGCRTEWHIQIPKLERRTPRSPPGKKNIVVHGKETDTHTRTRDRAIRFPGHDVLPRCNSAFTFFPRSARPHVRRISVRLLLDVSGAFVCTSWLAFSLPPVARGQHATQREVTCVGPDCWCDASTLRFGGKDVQPGIANSGDKFKDHDTPGSPLGIAPCSVCVTL